MLLVAAAIAAALAAWALVTGGFRFHLFGIPISVRGAHRAGVISLLLAAAGLGLHRSLREQLGALTNRLPFARTLPIVCAIAAVAVLVTALKMGTRTAAGSDIYGYVSQAALWRQGIPRIHQPIAAAVPWPDAEWTFAPLGYRPAPGQTIVPTYAPGLPLLMALFASVFGPGAEYFVVPICGAVLVWLSYLLGRRVSSAAVGTIAALAIATSPAILFMTLWSMSDVPVAVFWTASLLLACRQTRGASAGAGIAAGIAVLIRPNLAPLAIVPLAIAGLRGERRGRLARFAVYVLACAPFALFVGWLFDTWYGSPLRSGYGAASDIYAVANVRPNTAKYIAWLWESQGPLPFAFPLALWLSRSRDDRIVRLALAAFAAIVLACYVAYIQFDVWWYVRFLIPALPPMLVLGVDGIAGAAARFGPRVRIAVLLVVGLASTAFTVNESVRRDVFSIGQGERKYEDVGRHVAEALPSNAAVYAVQHSGSIRHYSGRLTLRLDYMDPLWLDRSIAHMRAAGYEAYFVVDDWEVPAFVERFRTQQTASLLALEPSTPRCTHRTFVFRVADRTVWRVPARGCR